MRGRSKRNPVAVLNDRFRRSLGRTSIPGRVVATKGIADLPQADQQSIFHSVISFDEFTEDNDPYGEHDFGSIEHGNTKVFWKIDYYANSDCEWGSEKPEDPTRSYRILTVMLACEY